MTNKPEDTRAKTLSVRSILSRVKKAVLHNWGLKLGCLALSVVLWGGLISNDGNLTREKTFTDVAVTAVNADILQRNGLVVVSGLEELGTLQMRVEVPQRYYNSVTPSTYNTRVDLSRITSAGEQMLPIITNTTSTYGQVTWLSRNEVKVVVDDYITRRRIPVQLEKTGTAPAGFYAPEPSIDPALVVISGPRQEVQRVARCVAVYDLSRLTAQPGSQLTAVPFVLQDANGQVVDSSRISVTTESVLLDTVLVDQRLYPLKTVDINLGGITSGQPKAGYHVASISASPSYLSVAGTAEFLRSLTMLEVSSGTIDIAGAGETLIRAVKIERPQNALYMSEDAVYVTVEIVPDAPLEPTATPEVTR